MPVQRIASERIGKGPASPLAPQEARSTPHTAEARSVQPSQPGTDAGPGMAAATTTAALATPPAHVATGTAPRNPIRLLPPEGDVEFGTTPAGSADAPPKSRFRRLRREKSPEPLAQTPLTAEPPTAAPELATPRPAPAERPSRTAPAVTEVADNRPPDDPALEETDAPSTKGPRRFGKLILVVVTILVVVAIVAIIRSSASDPGANNSLTPTTVKPHSKASPPTDLIPVNNAVTADFTAASVALNAANAAVTRAVAGGAVQTPAQVAQEVAPYVTALNAFNFKTHYLAWPTTLTVPAQDLTLRTSEMISFLSSISSVTPTTLTSWFAQFHSLARLTETTDNALRQDIGLPATTSYPT